MRHLLLWLLFLIGAPASAAPLPPVLVDGREWLQPIEFVGLGWDDIAAVCDPSTGACNGQLGGHDMTGWSWASTNDLSALFNHYIGSDELGPGADDFSGDVELGVRFYADGWLITQELLGSTSTSGFLADASTRFAGYFQFPPNDHFSFATNAPYPSITARSVGAWFTRGEEVPVPATLPLLSVAIAGLWLVSYRSRSQRN